MIKGNALYMPIIFFVAYIVSTLALALFGPVEYVDFPKIKVASYIFFILGCCVAGYQSGIKSLNWLVSSSNHSLKPDKHSIPKGFNIVLFITLIGLVGYLFASILAGTFNTNVTNLGDAYNTAYSGYQRNTGTYTPGFIAYTLFSIPMFMASVWGVYFFKHLGLSRKLIVLTILISTVAVFTLGSGKMKQLGDSVIYLIAIAAIARGASGRGVSPRFIVVSLIAAFAVITLLSFVVTQRYAVLGIDDLNINQKTSWHIKYDTGHPVFQVFGPGGGLALSFVCNYLGGGYYGLGLALNSWPTWSHFLGSSYSLSVIGERLFGLPSGYFVSYPYLTGVETGWGESHWYSVFPWFASDFTFVGTGLLFGLFAFWYARAWMQSIILSDPYAVLLFTLMTVGLFYVPANNQLMHSPGALATLLLVVTLYVKRGGQRQGAGSQRRAGVSLGATP